MRLTSPTQISKRTQKPMKHNKPIANLVNLPMEIHFHIRNHLLRDPYTHTSQLRILRLVCQLFDIIWSPLVFNNILLFRRSQTHHDRVKYLRSLVRGKALSCTTLTLQNWDCIDTDMDWFLWNMKFTWEIGAAMEDVGLRLEVPFLILASPAMWLGKFLLGPRKCFTKALDCIRSRFYASLLPHTAQFAHIRCVKMTVTEIQSRWAVYRSTRILSALPQLTELELNINPDVNWEHIAQCLNNVTSLRTFRLIIWPYKDRVLMNPRHSRISRLQSFIARNPYLTRLVLVSVLGCGYCDLSELFLDIPSNKPLKLDHISLQGCTNHQALIPHLQALSSFEFSGSSSVLFLADLMKAKIFPPTITVEYLDLGTSFLFEYLRSHPGIISLSFLRFAYCPRDYINDRLSSILVQHSKTLRSLKMPSVVLADALRVSSIEMSFLRCTNLREIVLIKDYPEETNADIRYEKQVFPIIARLDPLLTVGFTDILDFRASIDYCRTSDNPLVRDLAGRLFFVEE
ncbi:hypothetical protein M378DRAFT_24132 [Amanita muscaria Koide BX008]|uniref:Uncharacterized protein n=1 Tax=Amanita muscaria (strain Koide BX008) TaxID=946122 RepID=A0A0C2SQ07_AMAMK|nr:hypothetical protein M378DRAFT_24132 [Amanita muscaria Koide BX008]